MIKIENTAVGKRFISLHKIIGISIKF